MQLVKCKNVNVYVLSLISRSSAHFTIYTTGIGTLAYTVSSPLGRIQHLYTLLVLDGSILKHQISHLFSFLDSNIFGSNTSRAEVLRTPSSTQLGLKPMTFRSLQ